MSTTDQFIEDMCRFNYEKADGALYQFKLACNIPYDDLPEEFKQEIRTFVKASLEDVKKIDPRLPRNENNLFWEKTKETLPSDEVIFETYDDVEKISTFWMPEDYNLNGVPADIIFNKTVPITDMVLNFKNMGDEKDPFSISFRVFLYNDYKDIVDHVRKNDNCLGIIGGIIPFWKYNTKKNTKQKRRLVAYPIAIGAQTDFIISINIAYKNCSREEVNSVPLPEIHKFSSVILSAFYGCQLALLNPIIEKVFSKARENCIESRKITNGESHVKKRKIMYIKRYYIREKDITKSIDDYRTRNVKCPLWWVIGHKRHYKNGKTIWIPGYWKGVDRNKVKALSETESMDLRQRLIDIRKISE